MTLVERIRARLLAKLPEGGVFRRDRASFFFRLFTAIARELARVDERATELLTQAPPWLSVELLPEWERVLGLPSTGSIGARQLAVGAKLGDQGGCSIPYMRSLAVLLGYDIEITEYLPWQCGISSCVDPLVGDAWMATWTVTYASGLLDSLLQSTLIAARPNHTVVHFVVDGDLLVMDGELVTFDGETVIVSP